MPAERLVRTRKPGWCDADFAHPSEIRAGNVVLVTTHYPSSEAVSDFGVAPWTRTRKCSWCVRRDMESEYTRVRTDSALVARWNELTGDPEPDVSGGVPDATGDRWPAIPATVP